MRVLCRMVLDTGPRAAGNKVPLKLTSLNFELMAGLPMGDAGGAHGLSLGGPASGAPHSAGALGHGLGVGLGGPSGAVAGAPAWNPMSAGPDAFFLPAGKQLAMPRNEQRKGSARAAQWRVLDQR